MRPRTYVPDNVPIETHARCVCCGSQLVLGVDRRLICLSLACPDPDATHRQLQQRPRRETVSV